MVRRFHSKLLLILLCVLMILFQFPAIALGPLPSDLVSGSDVTELMFNTLIEKYFESRSKLNAEEISLLLANVTNIGMMNDELQRLNALQTAQVIEVTNHYQIDDYGYYEYVGIAMVTETVTYTFSDYVSTDIVFHKITFSYDENNTALLLTSDEYYEQVILFESCSYYPYDDSIQTYANNNATNDHANTGDYAYDIVMIAETQIGYIEKASNSNLDSKTGNAGTSNYTKYGAWYRLNPAEWCVIFVSWCANQANIATTIIKKESSTSDMKTFFNNAGRFYPSKANGGTYTPQIGDIYFQNGHTAIVADVTDTTVTIIEGNAGSNTDRVQRRTLKLTSSVIVGYGNPAYTTSQSAHDYVNTNHTLGMAHTCSQCGKAEIAVWSSTHGSNMTHECSLCGYTVNASWIGNHSTSAMMHTCSVCGVADWAAWNSDHGVVPIHECSLCHYTREPDSWICDHSVSMAHTCSFCNYSKQGTWYGDHAREDNHFCSVCDYENEEMTVNSRQMHNRLKHWRECTSCNDVWDEENHSWIEIWDGRLQCVVCNYIFSDTIIMQDPTQNSIG